MHSRPRPCVGDPETRTRFGRLRQLARRTFYLIWAIGLACSITVRSSAQEASPESATNVVRVYVPKETISPALKVFPDRYEIVDRDRLTALLRERLDLKNEATDQGISEAVYLARLEGDVLVSDASFWSLASAATTEVGNVVLPLKRARNVSAQASQLFDLQRFGTDGSLVIRPKDSTKVWFGFSLRADVVGRAERFRVKVPVAVKAKMLIEAPESVLLQANDLLVEPVVNPADYLPEDWPDESLATLNKRAEARWWIVDLGGVSSFELLKTNLDVDSTSPFYHQIPRTETVCVLGEGGIRQTTQIELANFDPGKRLRLSISKGAHISRITLDNTQLRWTEVQGMGAEKRLIDLIMPRENTVADSFDASLSPGGEPDADAAVVEAEPSLALTPSDGQSRDSLLIVEAVSLPSQFVSGPLGRNRSAGELELPEIKVLDSYCLAGRTRVQSDPFTDVLSLRCSHGTVRPIVERGALSSDDSPENSDDVSDERQATAEQRANEVGSAPRKVANNLIWDCFWSGSSPELTARFATKRSQLRAETMTRLIVGANESQTTGRRREMSADCRVHVSAGHLQSNEIRVRVSRGWFLDRATLVGDNEREVDLEVIQEERNGRIEDLLQVTWAEANRNLEFDLSILVHGQLRNVEQSLPRIVTVVGAEHSDVYAIEADESNRLKVTEKLMRHRLSTNELTGWQRGVLSEGADGQFLDGNLFSGNGRRLPPLELANEAAEATTKVVGIAQPLGGFGNQESADHFELKLSCIVELVTASSGPSKRTVRVPQRFGSANSLGWYLLEAGERIPIEAKELPGEVNTTLSTVAPDSSLVELKLPATESGRQIILVEGGRYTSKDQASESKIELLRVIDARRKEDVLLLPARMLDQARVRSQSQYTTLEVLPAEACFEASQLRRIMGPLLDEEDWIGLRDTSGSGIGFEVGDLAEASSDSTWIEHCKLVHQLDADNTFLHDLALNLRGQQGATTSIEIPVGWELVENWSQLEHQVFHEFDADENSSERSEIRVTLPRSGELSLAFRFASKRQSNGWISRERLESPTILAPVLNESRFLRLPAAWQPMSFGGDSWQGEDWMKSMLPSTWWRWVHPHSDVQDLTQRPVDRDIDRNEIGARTSGSDGWTTIRLSLEEESESVWIAKRAGIASIYFTLGGILAFLSFYAIFRFPRSVAAGTTVLLLLGIWLPTGLSVLTRIACLGLLSGGLARMCWTVSRRRSTDSQRSERKRLSTSARLSPSGMASLSKSSLWLGLLLGLHALPCTAQSPRGFTVPQSARSVSESIPLRPSATDSEPEREPTQLYELLIPTDGDEISGSIIYAPKELLRRLEGRQGEANGQSTATWIQNAAYTVRLGNADSQVGFTAEISAEFQVDVGVELVPMRLPFSRPGLELVGVEINGEPDDMADPIVKQDQDVVFSPRLSGPVQLRLLFRAAEPDFDMAGGAIRFEIPPIASSTLVVNHDPMWRVSTNAMGTEVEFENRTSSSLGPTDFLSVQWQRKEVGQFQYGASSAKTHVWAHGAQEHVSARGVVRVANPMSLPRAFHVVVNDDWVVVGDEAGDASVQRSARLPLSNKRRYELVWNANVKGTDDAVVDLSLARSPEAGTSNLVSLRLPQPYIQELAANEEQYLSWSSTADCPWQLQFGQGWLPVGEAGIVLPIEWNAIQQQIDSRVVLNEGTNEVNAGKNSYLLPLTRNAPLLIRRPERRATESQLSIDWHYEQESASIECVWEFDEPWLQERYTTELLLPSSWELESVEADGQQLSFREYFFGNQKTATIYFESATRPIQEFRISASKEIRLDAPHPLEKPALSDFEERLDRVSVFCRVGFVCRTQVDSSITELTPQVDLISGAFVEGPEVRVRDFEYYVGDLSTQQLDAMLNDRITCRFTLDRAEPKQMLSYVQVERRESESWEAIWNVSWENAEAAPSCLLLTCPAELVPRLQTNETFQTLQTTGSESQMLLVPIQVGKSGVEFSFPLETPNASGDPESEVSQGQLRIPNVQVVSGDLGAPLLVLPKKVGEDLAVSWKGENGTKLGGGTQLAQTEPAQTELKLAQRLAQDVSVHAIDASTQSIAWTLETGMEQSSKLMSVNWVVDRVERSRVTGWVDYWIRPGNEMELELANPGNLNVLGASNGSQLLNVDKSVENVVRIGLFPTRLPVSIRVFWQKEFVATESRSENRDFEFELFRTSMEAPQVAEALEQSTTIEIRDLEWRLGNAGRLRSGMLQRAELWCEVLVREVDRVAGLSEAERLAFWQSWTPARLELDETLSLPVPAPEFGGENELTVGECWDEVTRRLNLNEALISSAVSPASNRSRGGRGWSTALDGESSNVAPRTVAYGLEDQRCVLNRKDRPSNFSSKLAASIIVVASCIAGIWVSVRFRTQVLSALVAFPFLYWCLLAILCWLCLPVTWPGWILLAAACFLGVGNWSDHRRARAYR